MTVQVEQVPLPEVSPLALPSVAELYRRFGAYNRQYFEGQLPRPKIEYSARMLTAGSYHPNTRTIKIGRKYHEIFPEEIDDTLKHEMIHIRHFYHDAAFRKEAARIGASVRARSHPSLRKPPRYVYTCPSCGRTYPRQKRIRMASCGACSRAGRYDERFKLQLTDSPALRAKE
jgi:predicted SprT family Zn-dependent metalloprotease